MTQEQGCLNNDAGNSIVVDRSGYVYIIGYFNDTVDFDPGAGVSNLTSNGSFDFFIQKLDINGNFIWAKAMGSSSYDIAYSIALDASGNLHIAGYFNGTVDFDPGIGVNNLVSAGADEIFIQKLDANGNFIWAKAIGGTGYDRARSITVDHLGNVYTTGLFANTVDFDPGIGVSNLTALGNYDAFISKLDANGALVWVKSISGPDIDEGNSIAVDEFGNVYTTGSFLSTTDFDPGIGTYNLTNTSGSDIFVQKLDINGSFVWAKAMGSTWTETGNSIAVDGSGNVYTTGFFRYTIDFDPGVGVNNLSSNLGSVDAFVQKLDSNGAFVWAEALGAHSNDEGKGIVVDPFGNIYTTGKFFGFADFDPDVTTNNLTSNGNSDIFIQKLKQCMPNTGTAIHTACNAYTWIDGNTYTSSNNTATYVLTNVASCDSVITLNLTITNVDVGTTLTGSTILANNTSAAAYQWINCSTNLAITGAINASFTVPANGDYAVVITENSCSDTSTCVTVLGLGIGGIVFKNLQVYPNPTPNALTIDLGTAYSTVNITVSNTIGQKIQSFNTTNTQRLDLNLEGLSGWYFVQIETEKGSKTIKVLKQ